MRSPKEQIADLFGQEAKPASEFALILLRHEDPQGYDNETQWQPGKLAEEARLLLVDDICFGLQRVGE